LNYNELLAQHHAIVALCRSLLVCVAARPVRPQAAFALLHELTCLILQHVEVEDPVIYETMTIAAGDRYENAAQESRAELERLGEDWSDYLYRWPPAQIESAWTDFAAESSAILPRIESRLKYESGVLYSLALHYNVIAP
jgi:hypothetical protein